MKPRKVQGWSKKIQYSYFFYPFNKATIFYIPSHFSSLTKHKIYAINAKKNSIALQTFPGHGFFFPQLIENRKKIDIKTFLCFTFKGQFVSFFDYFLNLVNIFQLICTFLHKIWNFLRLVFLCRNTLKSPFFNCFFSYTRREWLKAFLALVFL